MPESPRGRRAVRHDEAPHVTRGVEYLQPRIDVSKVVIDASVTSEVMADLVHHTAGEQAGVLRWPGQVAKDPASWHGRGGVESDVPFGPGRSRQELRDIHRVALDGLAHLRRGRAPSVPTAV